MARVIPKYGEGEAEYQPTQTLTNVGHGAFNLARKCDGQPFDNSVHRAIPASNLVSPASGWTNGREWRRLTGC